MKSNLIIFPADAAKSNTSCSPKSFPRFPIQTVDDNWVLVTPEGLVEGLEVYGIFIGSKFERNCCLMVNTDYVSICFSIKICYDCSLVNSLANLNVENQNKKSAKHISNVNERYIVKIVCNLLFLESKSVKVVILKYQGLKRKSLLFIVLGLTDNVF